MTTPKKTAVADIYYPAALDRTQVAAYYWALAAWACQERRYEIESLFLQRVSDGECTDCVEDRIEFISLSFLNSAEGHRFAALMADELN